MDKLDLLKLVADLAERETDRTWRRTGTMLTLNAGLFVLVSVAIQNTLGFLVVLVSLSGVALSFLWYRIVVMSKFYEMRWHKDMEAIINSDEDLKEFVRGRNRENSRISRPGKCGATTYLKAVIAVIAGLWGAILILFAAQPAIKCLVSLIQRVLRIT